MSFPDIGLSAVLGILIAVLAMRGIDALARWSHRRELDREIARRFKRRG